MNPARGSPKNGFSLVEAIAAIGIVALIAGVTSSVLTSLARSAHQAEMRSKANIAIAEFENVTNYLVTSVSPARFDPAGVFVRDQATGAFAALMTVAPFMRDRWNLTPPIYSPAPTFPKPGGALVVPNIALGAFNRPNSAYDVEMYQVTESAANAAAVTSKALYLSRCVPVATGATKYRTLAQIDSLMRPVLQANNQLRCCRVASPISNANFATSCATLDQFWPTIFVYRGENSVTTIPADSDREVTPGIGFALSFDANPPSYFYLSTFILTNECVTGRKQFNPCARTTYTSPASHKYTTAQFNRDVVTQINSRSGSVVSDISGGSFIMLGPSGVKSGP